VKCDRKSVDWAGAKGKECAETQRQEGTDRIDRQDAKVLGVVRRGTNALKTDELRGVSGSTYRGNWH